MTLATVETEKFGTIPVRHRDCPLCGHNNRGAPESRFSLPPWTVRACRECGFVYIDQAPEYAVQVEQMAWDRTTKVEEERRAELRPISYKASKSLRFRMHILPKRTMLGAITARIAEGNLIDLGCGNGQAMDGFPPSFTPYGVEISAALAREADRAFRARGGMALNAPSVAGLRQFPENFFAAASLRSYLEHESEPRAVLDNLARALVPGGFAVVKVPNYGSLNRMVMGRRWCGFRYPDHLNYFTPRTLSLMAEKAGFDTGWGATGRLPTSDNMWAVLTKR
jgi:SAM-dependent methyltransferase